MDFMKGFVLFYLFVTLVIPASSLISFKLFMSLLLFFFIFNAFFNNRLRLSFISLIYVLLLVIFLLFSFFQINDLESGISFFFRTFLLFVQIFIFYVLIKNKKISLNEVINIVYFAGFNYFVVKLFLILLILSSRIDVFSNIIRNIVFTDYVYFIRLNLGNDAIIVFSLLFIAPYLYRENYNFRFIIAHFIILFLLVTSFTKYLLITYLITLLILTLKNYVNLIKLFILLIFIYILSLFFFKDLIDYIYSIYELRFNEISSYSDKLFQIELFTKEILNNLSTFLVGKGGGEYIEWFLKDEYLKFNYEVQWLSLIYQLGIIRISFIFFFLIYILFKLFKRGIYFATLFLLWIFASFTNPYLLIQSSFIIYVLAFLIIYDLKIKGGKCDKNSYSWNIVNLGNRTQILS